MRHVIGRLWCTTCIARTIHYADALTPPVVPICGGCGRELAPVPELTPGGQHVERQAVPAEVIAEARAAMRREQIALAFFSGGCHDAPHGVIFDVDA